MSETGGRRGPVVGVRTSRAAARVVVHLGAAACVLAACLLWPRPIAAQPTAPAVSAATYVGSELNDEVMALERDTSGAVYVFGRVPAGATSFPLPPTHFFGPQTRPGAAHDCYIGKLLPRGGGLLEYAYLAVVHDADSCEAATVTPTGEVFLARQVDGRIVVDAFSDGGNGVTRTNQIALPQLASATHLRVTAEGLVYAIGGCSVEMFDGELWPLPGGFQPRPAGAPSLCDAATNGVNAQHVLVVADITGNILYGSFFGLGTSQIEPTALEVDAGSRRAYIAGHTLVGPGDTLITTPNAWQRQQGNAACRPAPVPCDSGDAFLIVVNPALPDSASLEYASYIGGQGRESAVAMVRGSDGLIQLVGNTQSRDSFPGMVLDADAAIFRVVLDITQPPAGQLVSASAIVEGTATMLLAPHQAGARVRLFAGGTLALLAFTDDPAFALVNPIFAAPRDPNAVIDNKPLLLVHDPAAGLVLATYLDDVSLAHRPQMVVAGDDALDIAIETTEPARSTDGTSPRGSDVLLFGITGVAGPPPNTPPVAQANGDRTEPASSPAGARVQLYGGSSFDPDGDALAYTWTEGQTVVGTGAFIEVVLTPGDHLITLTVDDGRGGTDSDAITVHVVPNTAAGGPQVVTPPDLAWNRSSDYLESPITVRFANVTAPGFTSLRSRYELSPAPPAGLQFGSPPLHLDLATTALFSGNLQVCIDYRGMSFATADTSLQIRQLVNGAWVPLSQSNDPGSRTICATPPTLGTFALLTPAVAANRIALLAGQPLRTPFCTRAPGLDPNEGGLALDSTLCNTRGLAFDAARNYLYFAEAGQGDAIRRLDLTTGRLTTVAGTGFMPGAIDGPRGDPRDDDKDNVDPLTAPLNQVLRLALDGQGNLIVAEYGEGRIRKIDFARNRISTIANVRQLTMPSAMAIDASGALLFSSFTGGLSHIWRLTPGADGVLNGSADEVVTAVAGNGIAGFDTAAIPAGGIDPHTMSLAPDALAFGPDGSLYVAGASGNAAVIRIAPGPDGLVDGVGDTAFLVAGGGSPGPHLGDGTAALSARLFLPIAIAVAPNGDVYVGDTGNPWGATVRRIAAVDGLVTGAADEIITTSAGFHIYDPAFSAGSDLPFSNGDGHALSSIFGAAFDVMVLPGGDLLVNDFYQVRRIGVGASGGDTTAPVLTLPPAMVVEAQSPGGATVTFAATATDAVDGAVTVSCAPASGTVFPFAGAGQTVTAVTCSASDAAGNVATGSFTITVRDTTAPSVAAPASIVVGATEAGGARANVPQAADTPALLAFLSGGTALDLADLNPTRLASRRVDCAQPATVIDVITPATLFAVGPTCIDVAFADASGNTGHALAVLRVAAPIGGHVDAAGVAVVATDASNTPAPVTVTFTTLQQRGLVTAVATAAPAPAPAGLMFAGTVVDVRSTALAPASTVVCVLGPTFAGDRLLWWDGSAWVDRTAAADVAAAQICSAPGALGMFATARAAVVTITTAEAIAITDTASVLPSVMVAVSEQIGIADSILAMPATVVAIQEQIVVSDVPATVPQAAPVLQITLTPITAEASVGESVTWTAIVTDSSDDASRVVLRAASGDPRVQFARPAAANSPLTITVSGSDIVVSLATAADGALTSTAAQVAAAIGSHPQASALVTAATWPGSPGSGIAQPRALAPLPRIRIAFASAGQSARCLASVPGWCQMTAALSAPGDGALEAFLDDNDNAVRDVTELFATAQATWVDRTPPVLSLPSNLVFVTGAGGTVVRYAATAVDGVDGAVAVTCSPISGSTFPVGTTAVTCTAVDAARNMTSGSFNVTVSASPAALLQLVSPVVFLKDAAGRYIGSITVGNAGAAGAGEVRLTTAILNTTAAVSLPVQFGVVQPGGRVTGQVTFPGSASPAGSANLRMTLQWTGGSLSIAQRVVLPAATAPLWGWADLHTHPMSNLAFGGKLFHGGVDVGALLPAVQMPYDPQCRFDVRAISIDEALSDDAPTHGDPIQSRCGNFARNGLVQALEAFNEALRQPGHAVGSPTFVNWPRWNDITHQKMWVDWIRRARDGGLRVMVALSHNNRTLAELMGAGGPISGVKDDRASSDLQIAEIKAFAARHPDIMQVALTSSALYQIVAAGRIAVVLGVEVDNIGNFNDLASVTPAMVESEIDRLYAQGVRYVFPVHVTDNLFGDTAIYSVLFNLANRRETGAFWSVGCAATTDEIGFRSLNFPPALSLFIPPGLPSPPQAPGCLTNSGTFFTGHVNARTTGGVTSLGEFALKAMMRRGIIIDVDHLSDRGVETALRLAEAVQPGGGYPLVSGHSAIRDRNRFNAENSRSRAQLQRLGCLQGMFGLGTSGAEAYDWASQFMDAVSEMGRPTALCPNPSSLGPGRVAFGTDTNSLVASPRPTIIEVKPGTVPRFTDIYNPLNPANDNPLLPALPRSTTGARTWDYNFDGVAHYGMYADFVKDLRTAPASSALPVTGKTLVDNYLLRSADYFFHMWQKIESQRTNVH